LGTDKDSGLGHHTRAGTVVAIAGAITVGVVGERVAGKARGRSSLDFSHLFGEKGITSGTDRA